MNWRFEFTRQAQREMDKLSRRNPSIASAIISKIVWLVENADKIDHERLSGHDEYSLHVGQYRLIYLPDYNRRLIIITDLGKHDEVYRRLRQR